MQETDVRRSAVQERVKSVRPVNENGSREKFEEEIVRNKQTELQSKRRERDIYVSVGDENFAEA